MVTAYGSATTSTGTGVVGGLVAGSRDEVDADLCEPDVGTEWRGVERPGSPSPLPLEEASPEFGHPQPEIGEGVVPEESRPPLLDAAEGEVASTRANERFGQGYEFVGYPNVRVVIDSGATSSAIGAAVTGLEAGSFRVTALGAGSFRVGIPPQEVGMIWSGGDRSSTPHEGHPSAAVVTAASELGHDRQMPVPVLVVPDQEEDVLFPAHLLDQLPEPVAMVRGLSPGEEALKQLVDSSGSGHEAYEHSLPFVAPWEVRDPDEGEYIAAPQDGVRPALCLDLVVATPDIATLAMVSTWGWGVAKLSLTGTLLDLDGGHFPSGVSKAITAFLVEGLAELYTNVLYSRRQWDLRRARRNRAAGYVQEGRAMRELCDEPGEPHVIDRHTVGDLLGHQEIAALSTATPRVCKKLGPDNDCVHWCRALHEARMTAGKWVSVVHCLSNPTLVIPTPQSGLASAAQGLCRWRITSFSFNRSLVPYRPFYGIDEVVELLSLCKVQVPRGRGTARPVVSYGTWLRRNPGVQDGRCGAMLVFLGWVGRELRNKMEERVFLNASLDCQMNAVHEQRTQTRELRTGLALPMIDPARWRRQSQGTMARLTICSDQLRGWSAVTLKVVTLWFLAFRYPEEVEPLGHVTTAGEQATQQLSKASGGGYGAYEHTLGKEDAGRRPRRAGSTLWGKALGPSQSMTDSDPLVVSFELLLGEPDLVNLAAVCTCGWSHPRVTRTMVGLDLSGRNMPAGVVRAVTEFLVDGLASRFLRMVACMGMHEERRLARDRAAAYAGEGKQMLQVAALTNDGVLGNQQLGATVGVDALSASDFMGSWSCCYWSCRYSIAVAAAAASAAAPPVLAGVAEHCSLATSPRPPLCGSCSVRNSRTQASGQTRQTPTSTSPLHHRSDPTPNLRHPPPPAHHCHHQPHWAPLPLNSRHLRSVLTPRAADTPTVWYTFPPSYTIAVALPSRLPSCQTGPHYSTHKSYFPSFATGTHHAGSP